MLDNKKDDDGNGIADVNEINKQQLMTRKLALVLKTVNPNRMLEAWGGLAQAFAGVCAILKVQFAKVISLAVSIADQLRPVMVQFVAPAMVQILPSDYHHWIFPVIDVMSKVIGGSIAWFLFRVLAAVHSGMIGGLMCTRALLRYANNKKLLTLNHEETMLDEYTGWALAACGVYFQVFRQEQRQSARERETERLRARASERASERWLLVDAESAYVCVCACVSHRPPWCPCVCENIYIHQKRREP
jgi:hypothetical protein